MVEAIVGPRARRTGRESPRGFPPPQLAIPLRSRASIRAVRADAEAGPRTATDRPRSVTTIRSPRSTRLRYWLKCDFSSLTPTVAMFAFDVVVTL